MADQIREADVVLCVASQLYKERAEGRSRPDVGKGVQWEARLIRDAFHADQDNLQKFVPVVLPGQTWAGVPDFLGPSTTTVYEVRDFTVPGAETLLRFLYKKPEVVEPPLGIPPAFTQWTPPRFDGTAPPVVDPAPAVDPVPAQLEKWDGVYDVAVSFASAQRPLVEQIVRACEKRGLRVFYDRDNTVEFWGQNFITGMREIYGGARARYFMPFLSENYFSSAYPMDEFYAAMVRGNEVGTAEYILPVVVGTVRIPHKVLNPAVGFLRLEDYSVEELAEIIADRVSGAGNGQAEPLPVAVAVDEAFEVRLPNLPTADYSPFETLVASLTRVGELFERASPKLSVYGIRCLVRTTDSTVDVRVERYGLASYSLRIGLETSPTDRLVITFPDASHPAWATAEWDRDSRQARLRFVDLDARAHALISADALFYSLWDKVVDHLENPPDRSDRQGYVP